MHIDTVEYKKINEKMYVYEHKSGLKSFVIPKKGYSKKFATFATHYGSINSKFIIPGETGVTEVPDGIAHFLEHKLFDQEDGSVMDKFVQLGSNPNAYTDFNQTVYLFSCTDRFDESFRLLLDFVQNPYITAGSVEKEKEIIGQEIRMKADEPEWMVFFNLLRAFYRENPVTIDIAGTTESIGKIDRDILYKCYGTFYHPSNMFILVVGEVEPEKIFQQVDICIKHSDSKPEIKRIFPSEERSINKDYTEQVMAVSTPVFQMGFRDDGHGAGKGEYLMREVSIRLLLEMIAGRSSQLYNELYNEGLINNAFEFDYTLEENYAFSVLGGESKDPQKIRDRIMDLVKVLLKNGLDENNYERIKKALYGRYLRQLNSVERISRAFISVYFKDFNVFDYSGIYDKISFEYINKIFREHFDLNNAALSVIKPG